MADSGIVSHDSLNKLPLMPIRRLHNFAYCPRLFYFQWVENLFEENEDTIIGHHLHRNVDKPDSLHDKPYPELQEGFRLRSLKIESEQIGLVGVADLLERDESGTRLVDYKKGSARRDENGERVAKEPDKVQVLAHALLLKEHGIMVDTASIYYAEDKRHVPVTIDDAGLEYCRSQIKKAKEIAVAQICPEPLQQDNRCLYCSAYPICLPEESRFWRNPKQEKTIIEIPPKPKNDEGEVLVVQKPGAMIGHRGEQIYVSCRGEKIAEMPAHQLRAIYVYGAVQLSTQVMHLCLELGIDVAFFSPAGRFIGLLNGLPMSGIDARLGQYRIFSDTMHRLNLSREFIKAKIHNQRVLLMRNGVPTAAQEQELALLRNRAAQAENVQQLLGIEGRAAAVYFGCFSGMLTEDIDFDFTRRNKRPPKDPINSLLSLGYSVLCKELTGICHAVGLDPFAGFMHEPRYGRPALSLDLMEEFRPLIVDSIVLTLVNKGILRKNDFLISASGVFLKDDSRKKFWEAYNKRLDTEVTHPQFGYKMSYRRMFDVQARLLWRYVRGEAERYIGFTTR